MNEQRPDPEALLRAAAREGRGRLKVFLGAAPGVGKTYEMLSEGAARREDGIDVVVGVVETHGREETAAKLRGFEVVARHQASYQGHILDEMDIDAILARRPALVLVDELAHTNAPGSRHDKRWQDVEELLDAGIDVYSTLNIQHLESLNDVVASFTKVRVRETLPDKVLEDAEIEVVDIPPDDLIERLRHGKVYVPDEATRALGNFFAKSNLSALRELALRYAAQAVDAQMLDYVRAHAMEGTWAASDRLVVAISEQAGSLELVRAAKRLADALRAPWTAVHIETPRSAHFNDAENMQLADALHLATQLGGHVASVPAESVLEGLKRFTTEARATQLIVGKSIRSRWFELLHGSIVDRLVRETPGLAVQVLPTSETAQGRTRRRKPRGEWGDLSGYLVSLGLTVAVTVAGTRLLSSGNITDLGLLYLLPVMVAATRYGLRTGIVTSLACSLGYNFFFIPPTHTFTIEDPRNLITVLVLLGVAIVSSQLAARVREHALQAQASAAQNSALAGFARQLTGISMIDDLAQVLCAEIGRLLDGNTVLLMPGEAPGEGGLSRRWSWPQAARLETLDMAAANWAFENDCPAGRGSDTLTSSEWLFHPLAARGAVMGVFGLARSDARAPVRPDQLPLLLSLLDQAGLALERIALEAQMADLSQARERDRLRHALLSSVSHDLRTPLTTIMGTLAAIDAAGPDQAAQIATARGEAERLYRFVTNLLDMARIEAGALHGKIEPVDLDEAVSEALHELRTLLADHAVSIDIAPDAPMVLVDPHLFHHCLTNLIENAAKYGDPDAPITITAARTTDGVDLAISDRGGGIPEGWEERIFETFARIEGSDRKGGTGLGLAIVKGFALAMGLDVTAVNCADGPGARFTIHFDPAHLKDWPEA
ncbi:two-component system, OmpR family, sensor histidine kinase KdpD [Novosphingobium sp. CF614]|uniref:sensor histidine kinase n=1 Tax=Novosphingobium sp. CF614 TaxID=1884364 RepID=UPI0008E3DA07|nr:sensor histidine kinase KdpD [Novosphingobium sp. CF614]SFF92117.1 two-component system, OmpR family, sensor histidine kinase KdpD [Novosphingobium sp. CF614]